MEPDIYPVSTDVCLIWFAVVICSPKVKGWGKSMQNLKRELRDQYSEEA